MTQEEKRLLLKDLCTRLPYGVKFPYHKEEDSNHRECDCVATLYSINEDSVEFDCDDGEWSCTISEVKPYLRPMSSMTHDEDVEYRDIMESGHYNPPSQEYASIIDWLNAHHFDYRGLIEKGLALEAPNDMYKID